MEAMSSFVILTFRPSSAQVKLAIFFFFSSFSFLPSCSPAFAVDSLRSSVVFSRPVEEIFVPESLADCLREMLHPSPKLRSSPERALKKLSMMDLNSRLSPQVSMRGSYAESRFPFSFQTRA
jgi:hypothetical protein